MSRCKLKPLVQYECQIHKFLFDTLSKEPYTEKLEERIRRAILRNRESCSILLRRDLKMEAYWYLEDWIGAFGLKTFKVWNMSQGTVTPNPSR